MKETSSIIFFDGLCPMCHGWVKRIIQMDKRKIFRFAPLEGETAGKMLEPLLPSYKEQETIILYNAGKLYFRSNAILRIAELLGWPYKLICVGRLIPRGLRDRLYDIVAARRYKFGSRYESCPVPPEDWRDRFTN